MRFVNALEAIESFLTGWYRYPSSTLPRMQFNLPLLAVGLGCLMVLTWMIHRMGQRIELIVTRECPSHHWTWRSTFSVTSLLLLLFVAGVASVGTAHQVAWISTRRDQWSETFHQWKLKESGEILRSQQVEGIQATVDLKLFSEVLDQYHEEHGHWPPGLNTSGRGSSWAKLIVYEAGFSSYHRGHKWFESMDQLRYAANRHVFGINQFESRDSVLDGLGNTLAIGEVVTERADIDSPAQIRDPVDGINQVPWGFGGPAWQGGAQFLIMDGSVRSISAKTDRQVLKALATPHANDDPGNDW